MERVQIAGLPEGVRAGPGFKAMANGEWRMANAEYRIPYGTGDSVDSGAFLRGVESIERQLVDEGFLHAIATFDSVGRDSGVVVYYTVKPGSRARTDGWVLRGNRAVDTEALLRMLPGSGSAFCRSTLGEACGAVLRLYEARGYPLAEVFPTSIADSGASVYPGLMIKEGPLVVVSFLEFPGSQRLGSPLLTRTARFRAGAAYSPRAIESWQRNLEQSRLVYVSGTDLVAGNDTGYGVRLWVEERRSNVISAALGYSPDATRQLSGLVALDVHLLNSGRRLQLGWQAFGGKTVYRFSYTEPWLFGWRLSATGRVRHEVTDTIRSQTSAAVEMSLLTNRDFAVTFSTGYERVTSVDTSESVRTVWAGTGLALDTRDSEFGPRKGGWLKVDTRIGERNSGRSSDGRFIGWVETDLGVMGPCFGPLVLANSVHPRFLYSAADLPEFEFYRMGGAGSLRGYREEQFSGTALGWWNCELRWQATNSIWTYPFIDAGLVSIAGVWVLEPAYGVGCRMGTRIGVFGVDYGLAFRDSPLQGKVHLAFQGEF